MTDHEQSIKLISSLELKEKQVADILGISVPGVRLKKQNKRYNKFTESNLNKLKEYLEEKKLTLNTL